MITVRNEALQAIDAVADDLRDIDRILPTLRSGDFAGGSGGLFAYFKAAGSGDSDASR